MKPTPATQENRQKILAAARDLILTQGMDALSVRKLATASGLALKTIYNLYGNKANVLVALFETGTRALDTAMDQLEDAMAKGPWKTDYYLDWLARVEPMLLDNQAVIKPAVIAGFTPDPSPAAARLHTDRIKRIEDILKLAALRDLIWNDLDLSVCAQLIYTHYFGVVIRWARDEINDSELVVHGRYAILTILHTLINAENRRENTLKLLRELNPKEER